MLGNKWVRLFLCLFMLPLSLVLSMPGAASAATTARLDFVFDTNQLPDWGPIPDVGNVACQLPVAALSTGVSVHASSVCVSGPDNTPGTCQAFEGGCGSYTLALNDATGVVCGSASMASYESPEDGWTNTVTNLDAAFIPLDGSCEAIEACLTYELERFGADTDLTACVPLDLDIPEPDTGSCAYGTISQPSVKYESAPRDANTFYQTARVTELHVDASTVNAPSKWVYYLVVDENGTGTTLTPNTTGVSRSGWKQEYQLLANANLDVDQTDPAFYIKSGFTYYNNPVPKVYIKGVGMYRLEPGASMSLGLGASQHAGKNNPSACQWYWGEPIRVENPAIPSENEPAGPVTIEGEEVPDEPPLPDPITGDPEPEDPTDELSFWAAILALLRSIFNAITSIVSSILNGLKSLFIPDKGFLDSRVESLSEAWDGTAIGKIGEAFGDLTPGSVSGCGGLPLNVDFGNGVTISESIGAACSGSMATAAGMVRMAISAVLVLGGAVACVRGIGSGFNWSPGISTGGGS